MWIRKTNTKKFSLTRDEKETKGEVKRDCLNCFVTTEREAVIFCRYWSAKKIRCEYIEPYSNNLTHSSPTQNLN